MFPLHQPQARVSWPHALAGPEHHHSVERLPTCWVTKGHSLHWVWLGYKGPAWPWGLAIAVSSTGVCDWIPGLPSGRHSVSQPTQPLPPESLQISPVWVESLSKKWLQALLQPEAVGACLVARGENTLLPA